MDLANDFRDFVTWVAADPRPAQPEAVVTAKVVAPGPFPLPANDWRELLKDQPQVMQPDVPALELEPEP